MRIELIPAASAPSALNERRATRSPKWDLVAERLLDAKPGDWLRVLLIDAPGETIKNKQGNLVTAMRNRKLTVTTRHLGAHIWFRVKQEEAEGPKR